MVCPEDKPISPGSSRRSRPQQFSQHEWENSPVPDVLHLVWCIDSRYNFELFGLAVFLCSHFQALAQLQTICQPRYRVKLAATQSQARAILPGQKFERQHAHPDQVAPMDPLKALSDDRAHTQKLCALCGPVPR